MKTPQPQNQNQHPGQDNRRDTQKHRYADHDEKLTDDANFKEGKPKTDLDYRNTLDNLEAEQ